jgi:hypothetical protein
MTKKDSEKLFDDFDGDPLADPLETPSQKTPAWKKRLRMDETFACVPYEKAMALGRYDLGAAAWLILIELDRLILVSGGYNPVRLPSRRLQEIGGVSPMRKSRGLRQLEEAKVVTVERGNRRSPLITSHWFPLKPGFDEWQKRLWQKRKQL